jgi:hypothetical protein
MSAIYGRYVLSLGMLCIIPIVESARSQGSSASVITATDPLLNADLHVGPLLAGFPGEEWLSPLTLFPLALPRALPLALPRALPGLAGPRLPESPRVFLSQCLALSSPSSYPFPSHQRTERGGGGGGDVYVTVSRRCVLLG